MTQAEENMTRYGIAPSLEQINTYLASTGMSIARFERYFGIPTNILKQARQGRIGLPAAYWHTFYEALKLEGGISYRELRSKHVLGPKTGRKSGSNSNKKAPVKPYQNREEEVPSHLLLGDSLSKLKPKPKQS
jgi:hypothetical protein